MEEQVNGKPSKAKELLSLRRRSVPTSLGIDLEIRAIPPDELVLITRRMLDISSLIPGKGLASLASGSEVSGLDAARRFADFAESPEGKEFFGLMERVIRAGCIDPVFGTDPAAGAMVTDLPLPDQFAAYSAILELSGFTKKKAEEIRPS